MKKFLIQIFLFGLLFVAATAGLVAGTTALKKNRVNWKLPDEVTTLIVGNSHPETAIDDSLLDDAINLSQSGTAYFYSYLKIKKLIETNPQIDTVVLGYYQGDLKKSMDDWFTGADKITSLMPKYLYLMERDDFSALYSANRYDVARNLPKSIFSALHGMRHVGGYVALGRNLLPEEPDDETGAQTEEVDYSKYQEEYLVEIYEYLRSRQIDLILLGVPIHRVLFDGLKDYEAHYLSFAQEMLPEAILVNHLNMEIPDHGYADLSHLNRDGAEIYTEFLKATGFEPLADDK